MKLLTKKGAAKTETFKAKIPLELSAKIDELTKKIEAAGFEIDWDSVVSQALQKAAVKAEADLKEAAKVA